MSEFTPNLNLEKPNFNVITWHDAVNGNFDIIDDLVGSGGVLARYALFASGKPAAAELLVRYIITDAVRFPGSLSGSRGVSLIAATSSTVFDIKKNGVQFGTATFAPAATTATFAGLTTDFADTDVLSIEAPGSQDATLSGISLTLEASRIIL